MSKRSSIWDTPNAASGMQNEKNTNPTSCQAAGKAAAAWQAAPSTVLEWGNATTLAVAHSTAIGQATGSEPLKQPLPNPGLATPSYLKNTAKTPYELELAYHSMHQPNATCTRPFDALVLLPGCDERASKCDEEPSKSIERASKSIERASKCDEELSKSIERASKCDEELSKSIERVSKSIEELSKSDERASKCDEELSKSIERSSKCDERMSKSIERASKCDEELSKCDERASKCDEESAGRSHFGPEKLSPTLGTSDTPQHADAIGEKYNQRIRNNMKYVLMTATVASDTFCMLIGQLSSMPAPNETAIAPNTRKPQYGIAQWNAGYNSIANPIGVTDATQNASGSIH